MGSSSLATLYFRPIGMCPPDSLRAVDVSAARIELVVLREEGGSRRTKDRQCDVGGVSFSRLESNLRRERRGWG